MAPRKTIALILAVGALLVPIASRAARPHPGVFEAALAAPVLIAPQQGAVGLPNDVMLLWSRVPNATSYHVQVSRYSNFMPTLMDAPLVADTSYVVNLASNRRYYWRVSASGPEGSSSYSNIRNFVVTAVIPPPPVLAAPVDGTQNALTNQTLTWRRVDTATGYRLKLCTTPTLSCSLEYWLGPDTTYVCSGLGEFTTYYWRIRAANAAGDGLPSATWSFQTGARRPAPVLVAPDPSAVLYSDQVTFRWHPVSDALAYHLVVTRFWWPGTVYVDEAGLEDTTFSASLAEGVTRYWQVRAVYDLGPGLPSEVRDFQVWTSVPSSPALLSPPAGVRELPPAPALKWAAVGGAAAYRVQVSTTPAFAKTLVDAVVQAPWFEFDAPDTTLCFWRVNASNPLGTSPWSAVWSFRCRLPGTDADGGPTRAPVDDTELQPEGGIPAAFGIRLAAPNPVAGDLAFELALPRASVTTLSVFDLAGRRVLERTIGQRGPGHPVVMLREGRGLPNGVYVLRLTAEGASATVRFVVLR